MNLVSFEWGVFTGAMCVYAARIIVAASIHVIRRRRLRRYQASR
jgi:hypothetical protein